MVLPKGLWECALCQEKNDPKSSACSSCLAHRSTTLVSPAGLLDASLPDQEQSTPVNSAFRPEKKGRRKPGMKQISSGGQPEASAAERAMSELPNPYATKPAATSPTKTPVAPSDHVVPVDASANDTTSTEESLGEAAVALDASDGSASRDVSNGASQKGEQGAPKQAKAAVSAARKEFMDLVPMPEGDDEESLMVCPRSYIFENRLEKAKQLRQCGNAHFSAQKPEKALVCYARAEHHAEFDEAQLFEFTEEHRTMINDVRFPVHLNQGLCLHKLAVAARSGSSDQRSAALEVALKAIGEAKKAKAKPKGEFDELGGFDESDDDEIGGGDVAPPAATTAAPNTNVEAAAEDTPLDLDKSSVATDSLNTVSASDAGKSVSSSDGAVQKSKQGKAVLAPSAESKLAARVLAEAKAALALAPSGHFKSLSLLARAHLLNGNFQEAVETCNRMSTECQGLSKADSLAVATVQRDAKRGVAADQAREKATFGGFLAKLIDEENSSSKDSSSSSSSSGSSGRSANSGRTGAAVARATGPLFVPSNTFQGARAGYIFTTRSPNGTGYFRDEPETKSEEGRAEGLASNRTNAASEGWRHDNGSASLLRAWVMRWAPMALVLLVALAVSPEFRGGLMLTFASTAAALSGSNLSQGQPFEEPSQPAAPPAALLALQEPAEVPPPTTKRRWWKRPFERKPEAKKSATEEKPAVKKEGWLKRRVRK